MIELTVGIVAGIIALAMSFARVWCPTAIAYVLAAVLRDKESAATWNVAARALQSSFWPTFLHSDSSHNHGVRFQVLLATMAFPVVSILIAVAGVITPLGLYDELQPHGQTTPTFLYAEDPGAFRLGTSPRLNHTWSRYCTQRVGASIFTSAYIPCPYTSNPTIITADDNGFTAEYPFGYNTSLPSVIYDIYSSGTAGVRTTVSNFFDIEWRQLTWKRSDPGEKEIFDNGTAYSVGIFQEVDSSILEDKMKLVEGLVVDAKTGGIGFRNHTLPGGLDHGAVWSEDLLFIEPVTECVNTNLTLDWTITTNLSFSSNLGVLKDLVLTDRGGFAQLNTTYPSFDRDHAQQNPDLRARAYKGAYINNVYTMLVLNVTNSKKTRDRAFEYLNSEVNKTFKLTGKLGSDSSTRGMYVSDAYAYYLDLPSDNYPNPENISHSDISDLTVLCSGVGSADIANITNIYVGCGLVRGAPHRVDGGHSLTFDDGSQWSAPLYSCATAVRATIKTVHFSTEGSDNSTSLSALSVTKVEAKTYADNASMPLWGMEDSGMEIAGIWPVWGLVSPAYEGYPNVSTVRQPSFYIPGADDGTLSGDTGTGQNLPGAQFPVMTMNTVLSIFGLSSSSQFPDYSGSSSMSMLVRWQKLAQTEKDTGNIMSLIWTDLAASAVTGTKGNLGAKNAAEAVTVPVSVTPIERRIKYRLPFAAPAFLLVCVILGLTALAIMSVIFLRGRISTMHRVLRQTSVGRLMITLMDPYNSNLEMKSREWSARNAKKEIDLAAMPFKLQYPSAIKGGPEGQAYAVALPSPVPSPGSDAGEGGEKTTHSATVTAMQTSQGYQLAPLVSPGTPIGYATSQEHLLGVQHQQVPTA